MPLETAVTLARGRTAVQGEGGVHAAPFAPTISHGTVRVRRGLADRLDGAIEASLLRVHGDSAAGTAPWVYAARGGVKFAMWPALAVAGGLGGGASQAGGFVSPDLGLVLAYENRYLVPFFAVRAAASFPVEAREVDTTQAGEPPGTHVGRPRTTAIFGAWTGARMPVGRRAPGEDPVHGSILIGVGLDSVQDDESSELFLAAGAGAELAF